MAFISMNIASKKVTAPAYKHVGVLSIEIKTTCSTDPSKAAGNDYFSKLEERKRKSQDDNIIRSLLVCSTMLRVLHGVYY